MAAAAAVPADPAVMVAAAAAAAAVEKASDWMGLRAVPEKVKRAKMAVKGKGLF